MNGKDNYLMIVGDGPYLEELKSNYKNSAKIIFTGQKDRTELATYYSGSDIFLFPSDSDTFGMSVMEASACGLPCIVSDKGGPKEIIIENRTGFIIPSNDFNAWIAKVEEIIGWYNNNSREILNIRNDAVYFIQKKYNLNHIFPNLIIEPN